MKAKKILKFVKKANMWCITTWDDGKQKQEWSVEKPKEKVKLNNIP